MYIGSTGALRAAPSGLRGRRQLHRRGAGRASATKINVTIHIDNSVTVVDNGRGIPVDNMPNGKSAAEVVLTVLHAGGKFDNDSYKVSGGLHGVGVSVVNALSQELDLEIWRDGQVYKQKYERGKPAADLEVTGTTKKRGTKITFKPGRRDLRDDRVQLRHAGAAPARARVPERRHPDHAGRRARRKSHKFQYDGGIISFVKHLNKNKAAVNEKPIYMKGDERRHRRRDRAAVERRLHRKRSTPSPTTSTRTRAARTSRDSARR